MIGNYYNEIITEPKISHLTDDQLCDLQTYL